ncbi:MAG: GAF domain-containing protein [Pseudomonadota bacterium]
MSTEPSPDETYHALHAATGGRLFTVTVLDRAAGLARRVYTSHPDTYPVSGTKPMHRNDWTRQVIDNGEVFVANTVEEFAKYFPDHALIQSLGCKSAMNVPIIEDEVIGTVNILDKEHHFDDQRIAECTAEIRNHHSRLVRAFGCNNLSG